MAQGRQNHDLKVPIAALTGISGLALILVPGFSRAAFVIGWVCLIIVGLAIAGLALFGIFRLATPERNMRGMIRNGLVPPFRALEQKPAVAKPEREPAPKPEPGAEPALAFEPIVVTADLVGQLHTIDWFQFEKLIELVYRKLGYGVTRHGGANPDGGIDLIIRKDEQCVAVQCKQWKARRVGVQQVREFLGALTDADLQQGKFITLRGYTNQAMQFAKRHDLEIVTEVELARMLETTDAQSDAAVLELLRDTRKFCPKCEREMVIRIARQGPNPGGKFWGCSGYPECHFTMPMAETVATPVETAPREELHSFA